MPNPADEDAMDALRARLADVGYLTERVEQTLGGGRLSFAPRDLVVHERRLLGDEPFTRLVKLFLLGLPLETSAAADALGPVDLDLLARARWLQPDADGVRATVKLVPHGDLLIASDRDATGTTATDWVAGIHPPSVTLGKLTVRAPVARALDVGTGNGVQALLASHHAESVVATDLNARALAFAALNARLNGVSNIELREGSYFEPVAGEEFELVTCNPPYVISPESRYAYRDSGLSGDTVSRQVVEEAPRHLREGGFAHLLVSWAHSPGDWWTPLRRWVEQQGCDALLLYFGSDDPVTHAAQCLRPVADESTARFSASFADWLDYLDGLGIEAIAHGAVILRRRRAAHNWTRQEQVSLDRLEQASDHLLRMFESQDHLDALDDDNGLLEDRFGLVDKHRLEQTLTFSDGAAESRGTVLSLDEGLGFQIGLDQHTAQLLPLLDGSRRLREALAERTVAMGLGEQDSRRFEQAALPVVRRLLELGFLTCGSASEHG